MYEINEFLHRLTQICLCVPTTIGSFARFYCVGSSPILFPHLFYFFYYGCLTFYFRCTSLYYAVSNLCLIIKNICKDADSIADWIDSSLQETEGHLKVSLCCTDSVSLADKVITIIYYLCVLVPIF